MAEATTARPLTPPALVYAIGRIEPRFPKVSVEKEFAQAFGRDKAAGLTVRGADSSQRRESRQRAFPVPPHVFDATWKQLKIRPVAVLRLELPLHVCPSHARRAARPHVEPQVRLRHHRREWYGRGPKARRPVDPGRRR